MMEEASRKAIVEYERRIVTPAREGVRRQLFRDVEGEQGRKVSRAPEKGPERMMLLNIMAQIRKLQAHNLEAHIPNLKPLGGPLPGPDPPQ